jgi:glycosyltransferase involved in cell wall biosynthesis
MLNLLSLASSVYSEHKTVNVEEIAATRVTERSSIRSRRGDDQLGLVRQSERDLRVAIIGTRGYPSYYGGFETAVRILTPFLAEKGCQVSVYSRPSAVADELGNEPNIEQVFTPGWETRSLSTLSYGLTASAHAATRRSHRPDVALVMNVANGYYLPLLKAASIKTVVNVDGIEWHRDKWSSSAKAVFKRGAALTARWADEIICDSTNIADFWQRSYGRASHYIPYGGDFKGYERVPLGLKSHGYLLLVARLVPENSIGPFLEAVPALARDYPIVLVGSSGYREAYDEQAARLASGHDSVTYLGHVANDELLFSLWQHCGLYFHGHSVGGTNPALVQAMALGAPILARDTIYNREVLADTGDFVTPTTSEIIRSVRTLMSNPQARALMGARARDRALETFTWERMCENYFQVLKAATKS